MSGTSPESGDSKSTEQSKGQFGGFVSLTVTMVVVVLVFGTVGYALMLRIQIHNKAVTLVSAAQSVTYETDVLKGNIRQINSDLAGIDLAANLSLETVAFMTKTGMGPPVDVNLSLCVYKSIHPSGDLDQIGTSVQFVRRVDYPGGTGSQQACSGTGLVGLTTHGRSVGKLLADAAAGSLVETVETVGQISSGGINVLGQTTPI